MGLLRVQQRPEDRPSMSSVLLMLGSETASLLQPKQPGFFTDRNVPDAGDNDVGDESYQQIGTIFHEPVEF